MSEVVPEEITLMSKKTHLQASDLHGFQRLAIDALEGLTDLVEATHLQLLGSWRGTALKGWSGQIYRSIRFATGMLGSALEHALSWSRPMLGEQASSPERDAALVPPDSALGRHPVPALNPAFPKSRCAIACEIHHLDLLSSPKIYRTIRRWQAGRLAGLND